MPSAFDSWNATYRDTPVVQLPWYSPTLDADVEAALAELSPPPGRVLDLGTGPGTMAMEFARRGFEVVASDLSQRAIDLAESEAEAQGIGEAITWFQDDILDSCLLGPFALVHDRGCFHTLPPEKAADYVRTVLDLLMPGGRLYLKTFSREEPGDWGPYRYDIRTLEALFVPPFRLDRGQPSTFPGTLDHEPKANFLVLTRP